MTSLKKTRIILEQLPDLLTTFKLRCDGRKLIAARDPEDCFGSQALLDLLTTSYRVYACYLWEYSCTGFNGRPNLAALMNELRQVGVDVVGAREEVKTDLIPQVAWGGGYVGLVPINIQSTVKLFILEVHNRAEF